MQAATAPMMSGVAVPNAHVDPRAFFAATRRLVVPTKTATYAGLGNTDNIPILQLGVVSGISIKFSGTLTVTLSGGTAASTARWPYDLIRALRFSANGQSNLINCSGAKLRMRSLMHDAGLDDRGVANGIGGASPGTSRTQGTMALANESWGVGQNVTAIPGAPSTYSVELNWFVPVAFDQKTLIGAVFAQTSSTDLNLAIDWAPLTDLFVFTGSATATLTGTFVVETIAYTIPGDGQGGIIVPDLSAFHSLIQTRYATPSNGVNEVRLSGQGVGRQLMRVYWQVWNGSTPAPLAVNSTNVGQVGWRFGGNDTPELITDGQHLAYLNERLFNTNLASLQGVACLDFSSENQFRDSIDEGAATELRFLHEIPSGVSLTSPVIEYVQDTIFAGAAGA